MTTRLSLATLLLALAAGTTQAQYLPDFTGVDFNEVFRNSDLTREMEQFRGGMIEGARRDPRIVQAYQQYMQSGGYPVTFEVFAEEYYASRGFTDREGSNRVKREIEERQRIGMEGLREAEARRRKAQEEYMEGGHRIANERGNILRGRSTYDQDGAPRVLPHTWQPNSYHHYEGHLYYVDFGGHYHVVR